MKMIVEFDIDADIIDVPQRIIKERELIRRRFLKWLYDKGNKHKYCVQVENNGKKYDALCYRSDALVEWLNKKVLQNSVEKATIVKQHVAVDSYCEEYPVIQF